MTFYAHYDTVEDVFNEFVEDMETEIMNAVSGTVIDVTKNMLGEQLSHVTYRKPVI